MNRELDFETAKLGKCAISSPLKGGRYIRDTEKVLYHSSPDDVAPYYKKKTGPPCMEMAGPRDKIFFDPSKVKAGIVTCGGLCPGLNDVIRAIVLSLHYHYGASTAFGFRYGFEGLSSKHSHPALELTPGAVEDIHQKGGTILGSSRGPQEVSDMVDSLERMNISMLFIIGGDGTLRGGQAIAEEIKNRNLKIGVIGVPKTIDNDISYVQQSFGFVTAVTEARASIYSAHMEATGAKNGIGLVKLMGRHSGFIAAYATLANSEVNFCLIPEVRFGLETFLEILKSRLENRGHAVIVVGEGAGQDLMEAGAGKDASGNIRLGDIGLFLKDRINGYFKKVGMDATLKYIDPSYNIRSVPANAHDSAFCLRLGHNAVHAAMSGRTNMVVGFWRNEFTHLPISMAVSRRKQIDPDERLWSTVLEATGQPRKMK